MKKKLSAWLTALAFGLALVTAVLCFAKADSAPLILAVPRAAVERTQAMADSIGDYEALGEMMYGQPDLGVHRKPADPTGEIFWDTFLGSLHCEFGEDFYATDRGLARDAVITRLSFEAVTGQLGPLSRELLEQRVRQSEDMNEVYTEENEYRQDVVMEVVCQAAQQIAAREGNTETLELTVNLVHEGDRWWIVPDQSLLDALSWGS